jgi:hypothetical protein
MTTIENNKLLAEFMGYVNTTPTDKDFNIYEGKELVVKGKVKNLIEAMSMEFHTDWNWLMEVVEKIESLSEEQKVINFSRQNKSIFDFKLTESKIEATYNACIEFIKWYNENNPIN